MSEFGRRLGLVLLVVFVCAARPCGAAESDLGFGAGPEEPKPVITVSATSVPAGATFDVIADFTLDEHVKLYRDNLAFEWTRLEGAKVRDIIFPKPDEIVDPLATTPGAKIKVYRGAAIVIARLVGTGKPGDVVLVEGELAHQSCTDQVCFPPAKEEFAFELAVTEPVAGAQAEDVGAAPAGPQEGAGAVGFFLRILGAFVVGVLLSLTPCVYPMIPVTAAIIGARREKGLLSALSASLVYVLGMSIVYAVIGLLIARPGSGVRTSLQSAYVLVPIAVIFVALAVAMFAGLNLKLPSGLMTRLQGMLAGKKGMLSTFVLGAISGLIVGPCVAAPLAGLLTYIFQTGDSALGFWMLFAVAWGMGIPLILFGTATGLMPKSGPWMEWVKKLLGFALLWGALYFLRTVMGATAYQVSMAALLVAAAVFLGGFNQLTKESTFGDRLKKALGIAAVLAAALLLFNVMRPKPAEVPAGESSQLPTPRPELPFKPGTAADVDTALAAGQPVMLDFWAVWCTLCEEMDRKVYSEAAFAEATDGIVALKIDFHQEKALNIRYAVFNPPRLLFIGRDGKVREDLSFYGTKGLADVLELVRKFREREGIPQGN